MILTHLSFFNFFQGMGVVTVAFIANQETWNVPGYSKTWAVPAFASSWAVPAQSKTWGIE